MKKQCVLRSVLLSALAGAACALTADAAASGFALIEASASGMGNAYAGGAAIAEDAGTNYYNPAGLTRLKGRQLGLALHLIDPSMNFSDGGSVAAAGRSGGGNGGDAGALAPVPDLYYAMDAGDKLKFGLGINAPFGLKTEYDPTWIGRFQAIKSEIKSLNVNPSLAYKLNDTVSLGAGVSAQYVDVTLTRAVNFGAGGEGAVNISGDDWGYGYNVGALFELSPAARIGVAYRSNISQHLEGSAQFTRPAGVPSAAAPDGNVTADIDLPETASLSGVRQLDAQWTLMGDVTWTGWSRFKELKIVRTSGAVLSTTPENWKDTYRYALGVNYRSSDKLLLRAGIALDQAPVSDAFRTARIPDQDRTWLSVGANYRVTESASVDVGYAHITMKDANINDDQRATGNGLVSGTYGNKIDILSVQYNHAF
jgi:long-chain fatty acid transport protein